MKRSASKFQHGDVNEKSPVFGYWEPAPEPTIDAKGTMFGLREVLDVMASFPAAGEHRVRQAEGPLLMVKCISTVFQALIRDVNESQRDETKSCAGWTMRKVQQSEMGNPEQTHGDGG